MRVGLTASTGQKKAALCGKPLPAITPTQIRDGNGVDGPVRTLPDLCQRIREEHLDRVALVGALAAQIGIEIATLFKLIELGLRHHNRPPKQIMPAALAMPGDRLADLFSAGRYAAAGRM
jgi:hypothetical protein